MAMSTLTVAALTPALSILGPAQQFIFSPNLGSFQLYSIFVPTISVPSQINFEYRNSALSGFRWIHTTTSTDTFGQLKLQSFVSASPTGTDILSFNQDGSITLDTPITISANLNMNGYKIINLADPINPQDAATKNYVDGTTGGTPGVDYYAPGYPTYLIDTYGSLYNFFIGTNAGNNTLTGTTNCGIGPNVLSSLTTGSYNVAYGPLTLNLNTIGIQNTAIGHSALVNTTGNDNTAVGYAALNSSTGSNNTAFGSGVLHTLVSGDYNTTIGYNSSSSYANYTNCTFLGALTDATVNGLTNACAIGYNTQVSVSNAIVLGNGCNVGINTTSPNAPLQFANTSTNRKVVFYELANNSHQINSIGRNTNEFRFQTNSTTEDYIFYAAASSSASTELMRIQGNGFVCIGGGVATAPLQFNNYSLSNRVLAIFAAANNDHQFAGFGKNSGIFRFQISGTSDNYVFYAATSSSASNELMRLTGTGFLGIGTSTPHAPLQFSSAQANRIIVLYESSNNDHQYIGMGLNAGSFRFQLDSTGEFYAFFVGTSSTTSNELMRLTGTGNLGIGTPPNAPLQFANTSTNRKVVFYELANNSHQINSIGRNTNEFRFQANATTEDYIFYAATSSSASNELMRIQGNGFVTIGGGSSTSPLQFNGYGLTTRILVIYSGANNDHQFAGFGKNNNIFRFQVSGTSENYVFYAATSSSASNELMRLTGTGFLGIGTASPNAPLQFANITATRQIVLYENANNDHQINAIGTYLFGSSINMRYQVHSNATASAHVFFAGTSSSTSVELMRLTGLGFLGIGTASPSAPLQFAWASTNRIVVFYEAVNNPHQINSIGRNTNEFRFQANATTEDYIFYAGTSSTTSSEVARIKGTGDFILPGTAWLKQSYGSIYMTNNATTTSLPAATWTKIAGTTTSASLNQYTSPSSNRLTYPGTTTVNALVNASVTISNNSVGTSMGIAIFKNGVQVAAPIFITTSLLSQQAALSLSVYVQFATNDYVEVWAQTTAATTATVAHLVLSASSL